MTATMKQRIENRINDTWFVLDREVDEKKAAHLAGVLSGIRFMLDEMGYTYTYDNETKRRVIVRQRRFSTGTANCKKVKISC